MGTTGLTVWLAVLHVVALALIAAGLMTWRMQGDLPD